MRSYTASCKAYYSDLARQIEGNVEQIGKLKKLIIMCKKRIKIKKIRDIQKRIKNIKSSKQLNTKHPVGGHGQKTR